MADAYVNDDWLNQVLEFVVAAGGTVDMDEAILTAYCGNCPGQNHNVVVQRAWSAPSYPARMAQRIIEQECMWKRR